MKNRASSLAWLPGSNGTALLVLSAVSLAFVGAGSIRAQVQSKPKAAKSHVLKAKARHLTFTIKARKPGKQGMEVGRNPVAVEFKEQKPFPVTGRRASKEELEAAIGRGLCYVLEQESKRGDWRYSTRQVPAGPRNAIVLNMASMTVKRLALTALVGLALQTHVDRKPIRPEKSTDRAQPKKSELELLASLARARSYVIKKATRLRSWKNDLVGSAPWSAALSLSFLSEEYRRLGADDSETRTSIEKALRHLVKVSLESQHEGDLRKIVAARGDWQVPANAVDVDLGFGVGMDEAAGARILRLSGMPGRRSRLRAGDVIVSFNGKPVRNCWDYARYRKDVKLGDEIQLGIVRSRTSSRDAMFAGIPEDGGWSYTTVGTASMLTAHLLLALLDARSCGIEVPNEALSRAGAALQAVRFVDPQTKEVGYRYMTDVDKCAGIRGAIARTPLIELALVELGLRKDENLRAALRLFMKHRHELDRVLHHWGTHVSERSMNAPYYHLFGHLFAAKAANACGDAKLRNEVASVIAEVLLAMQRPDGTWTDHDAFGRVVGSSLALVALGEVAWLTKKR